MRAHALTRTEEQTLLKLSCTGTGRTYNRLLEEDQLAVK